MAVPGDKQLFLAAPGEQSLEGVKRGTVPLPQLEVARTESAARVGEFSKRLARGFQVSAQLGEVGLRTAGTAIIFAGVTVYMGVR